MERTLQQDILNEVDLKSLLDKFKSHQIAFVFKVDTPYVNKVLNKQNELQKFDSNSAELSMGLCNEWKELKETALYQQIMNK